MCVRHVVICGLSRSTNFFPYYLIKGTIFGKKVMSRPGLKVRCDAEVLQRLMREETISLSFP